MGVTPFISTGLREMEGAPRGGCASVDTVDCRESGLRSPLTVEHDAQQPEDEIGLYFKGLSIYSHLSVYRVLL